MGDNKELSSSTWANQQVATLLEAGVNPLDAQRSISWMLDNVPIGDDPAMWIPTVASVAVTLDKASIADVRAVWYERKETKVKRLLDARTAE